jgi:hypothetical protein
VELVRIGMRNYWYSEPMRVLGQPYGIPRNKVVSWLAVLRQGTEPYKCSYEREEAIDEIRALGLEKYYSGPDLAEVYFSRLLQASEKRYHVLLA